MPIVNVARKIARLRFRLLGHATIKDIPTQQFNEIIHSLRADGWRTTYVYQGPDAWLDYGCIKLAKDGSRLVLEWDNWTEGSIEGPRDIVAKLGAKLGLAVTDEWRWSEYDRAAASSQREK